MGKCLSEQDPKVKTQIQQKHLEFLEFFASTRRFGDLENVETHGLGQWPALADCDDVAQRDVSVETKCRKKKIRISKVVISRKQIHKRKWEED